MARADSTIRVNIIGDAKGLQKELGKVGGAKGLGGLGKLVGGIGIGVVTAELLDFGQTALNEADRAGDALTRLQLHLGPLADELGKTAEQFQNLGLSRQDTLELEAAFADVATSLGLANPLIAAFADDAAATAAAIALLGDQTPEEVIGLIGKAAGGSEKALKALGISLTDAEVAQRAMRDTGKTVPDQLTKSELAAAAYSLVLEKLKPKLDAVAEGSGDVEQKQAELQARFETLTGKIGEGLEGPLEDFLGWTLAGVDGIGQLGTAFDLLDDRIKETFPELHDFIDLIRQALTLVGQTFGGRFLPTGGGGGTGGGAHPANRPGVGGGAGDRNIVNAVQDYQERNGRPVL